MQIYGYCRISTPRQNIERQVRNIAAAYPTAHIVREVYTGTACQGRRELDKLVTKERGNVYVVQHDDIVAALELRDADLAQQRMGAHIDTMLSDVKHQIEQIQALAKEDSVR